ncbi:hypothetical protein FHETE_6426 [Fusarium heterosporum]|uniref:Uncharacterized protein n=1 Tax=Fusarium heterosporum TaxID=42747 RepID=A0A8H5TAI1_FUSHE|nr:hypothetical protein FHETE_6426 [Fusarium heterosporum]
MTVQTNALLLATTLVFSVAGAALSRVDLGQQGPWRFPLNDTAIVTAPYGSNTRLSQLIPTSTSTWTTMLRGETSRSFESTEMVWSTTSQADDRYFSSPDKIETSSTESAWTVSLEIIPISSSQETELTATTPQLDSVFTTLSKSTGATLSTPEQFPQPTSSMFLLTTISSNNSDSDKVSTPLETGQKRPHQAFVHTLTEFTLDTEQQPYRTSHNSSYRWIPSLTSKGNGTYTPEPRPTGILTLITPTSVSPCTTLQDNEPITEYSIVYTATVTFLGNSSEYTPPYPAITTPNFCETQSPIPTVSQGRSSTGAPASSAEEISQKLPPKECSLGDSCSPEEVPGWTNPTANPISGVPGVTMSTTRRTITFVTTDKNPAVVFTTEPPPKFGKPTDQGRLPVSNKQIPEASDAGVPDGPEPSGDPWTLGGHGKMGTMSQAQLDTQSQTISEAQPEGRPQDRPQTQRQLDSVTGIGTSIDTYLMPEPTNVFFVTARGQEVIVNEETFSSLKVDRTTTVTVGSGTFTIRPTEVVGEGVTVKKPQPIGTAIHVVKSTSTTLAQVPVTVVGTEAVVGGTRFKIPIIGTTTKLKIPVVGSYSLVDEHQISIAPGHVVVDNETLTYQAIGGPQTDVIIEGGEMITVAGKSVLVLHSTTLTYGFSKPNITETIDDDIITVGPAGVIIDGTILGGAHAEATDTKYRIVGGATITKVSPSYVIIDETTFTAGPGAKSTTKKAGGETITIGPSGIIIGTMTVKYPFGASTVTTIQAKATATESSPIATRSNHNNNKDNKDNDDDSGAAPQRSGLMIGMTMLHIAAGVWVLV